MLHNLNSECTEVTAGGDEITCTPNHPFYSPVKGWTSACKLHAGDILVTLNGEYVVVEQVQHELLESPETTYNFEVEDMLRAASEEFPNEPQILLKLAQALHMWGWNKYGAKGHPSDSSGIIEDDIEYNSQNIYWQEAVRAYEKILKSNPSSEEREITIRQITPLYCRMGEYEKAKALANDQNSIVLSKEVLLPLATVGEEKARYQGERIMALLSNLRFAISEAVATRPAVSTSEYGRQILLSVIKLYETVFNDGRCGRWHWDIGHLYLTLVHYETDNNGSIEKILNYFDKGFDHCKEYARIYGEGEYIYSSPLISAIPKIDKGDLAPLGDDFWEKQLRTFQKNIVKEIRKNPKYAECFE